VDVDVEVLRDGDVGVGKVIVLRSIPCCMIFRVVVVDGFMLRLS
jgi:hypothetical protein